MVLEPLSELRRRESGILIFQKWLWPERYGTQPEILRYVNHIADRFDLRREIEFNTRVKEVVFDSKTNAWTVKTGEGEDRHRPILHHGDGQSFDTAVAELLWFGTLQRELVRHRSWRHEGIDFTGLSVGVIGTDSSGVQSIPIIAKQAKYFYVFQRTANLSLPAGNAPMNPNNETAHKAEYHERRRAAFDMPFAG
jgi:cyclohexanone monooxygenase